MTSNQDSKNGGNSFLSYFSPVIGVLSSLKFTIFILILIAAVSIIGTVVEQGKSAQDYFTEYGDGWGKIIMSLRLDDMYHTGWFTSLLVLLVLNIIACTYERFPAKWRVLLRHDKEINESVFDTLSHTETFRVGASASTTQEKAVAVLKGKGYSKHVVKELPGNKVIIYAWKGILGRFGSDITHVSLFFILLGCIVGGYWGYRDYKNIIVGESISVPEADFMVKLDNFWIDYYDNGSIRQYNSLLAVVDKDGKEEFTKQIWVNEPLRHKGIIFYQSSWGKSWNRIESAELHLKRKDTNSVVATVHVPWNEITKIPGSPYSVRIESFVSDFAFDPVNKQIYSTGMDHKNPAVSIEIYNGGKSIGGAWLFGNYPGAMESLPGTKYEFELSSYMPVIFSGLSITKDPGTNIVWLGTIIMGVGLYLALFVHFKRFWVEISEDEGSTAVRVAAMTNKSTFALERDFNKVVCGIKENLPPVNS